MDYSQLDLFHGINSEEIQLICECFGASVHGYSKGEMIVHEGELVKRFGVVLSGRADSFKTDISGRVFTVAIIRGGGYIGAFLAGLAESGRQSPVTVTAAEELTVLFIPFDRLVKPCSRNCESHTKVLSNFIAGVCIKGMLLYERIDCLIQPTIREKIMAYLGKFDSGTNAFEIPFDREGLAEYLNTDRSALSRELSKMKRDGLIDYCRNVFRVL